MTSAWIAYRYDGYGKLYTYWDGGSWGAMEEAKLFRSTHDARNDLHGERIVSNVRFLQVNITPVEKETVIESYKQRRNAARRRGEL